MATITEEGIAYEATTLVATAVGGKGTADEGTTRRRTVAN